ncbi:MAG: indole-3-glycerol phosphate synthase TrpC [Deltaproteobacteria bacterium]|nr:indole-3-glycerol phosphate synthase TrpC [Deltaproteobacteria bacterium]
MWLDKILRYKREEMEAIKRKRSLKDVRLQAEDQERAREFADSLTHPSGPPSPARGEGNKARIIAEIKKASPSAGLLRPEYDPIGIAQMYEENGASAISILTDRHFFQGDLSDLTKVRQVVRLPVLRKDFIFDEYQIYEARGAGADAVLLIVRLLEGSQLEDYLALAHGLGMAALVEVHDENDLNRAVSSGAGLIGVNNRDLDSLKTDVAVTERLAPKAPKESLLVSESGISTRKEVERLQKVGVNCFLIGESLLREKEPGQALKGLLSPPCPSP